MYNILRQRCHLPWEWGKGIHMKLSTLLSTLVGQTLTSAHVSSISAEVDNIKGKAVGKVTEKLEALQTEHKSVQKELTEFKDTAAKAEFKAEWVKQGGKESAKLEDYNLNNYKDKDGKLNYKTLFETHPNLKGSGERKEPPAVTERKSAFSQLQNLSSGGGNSGSDGGSDIKVY